MAYISNLKELEEQFRIETVVEHYEQWTGDDRKKIDCPFHKEKTASFSVSKIKNVATCFGGCGSYGPLHYVRTKENCDYVTAIEICAKIHKLEVKYDTRRSPEQQALDKKKLERQEQMYAINALVADAYFAASFTDGELGDDDIITFKDDKNTRTLTGATVKKFGVCHTSSDWDFITSKFDNALLIELGIIRERKEKGGYYDSYRNRQLFPIKIKNGKIEKVVGFGARRLVADDSIPKYLNSPENIIYNKSTVLYGYYEQARYLAETKTAYLVEGYWDVLTPYSNDFYGAVAGCGTAFTQGQARLLKRHVDHVVILYDNDESKDKNAGLVAAQNALPILLEEGLRVSIVLLPKDQDPDSFVREHGGAALADYVNTNRKDALLWYIDDCLRGTDGDAFAIDAVSDIAVELLHKVKKETAQQIYTKEIANLLGMKESSLMMKLRDKQSEALLSNDHEDLSEEQRKSLFLYGMYEHANQYFCMKSKGTGYAAVSNFIVKPLFLLDSPTDPKRLFEITNKYGQSKLVDIEGTALINLESFKKTVEPRGNFRFFGSVAQYEQIKAKIYDLMTTCYEIDVLGYHKDGFYAFGNGIFTKEKTFLEANKYGVVEYNQKRYFLPAFSDIYKDSEMSFADEKNFVYKPSAITFEKWAKLFCEVHGDNGKIAICFYIAALFRSSIKNIVKLPLLNLFGQPQSGKSLMLENLSAMFGYITKAFNLNHGTDVGFANKVATVRDALIFLEEYKNDISKNKIEGMKGMYDDVGRERGQKTHSKNIKTLVHSTGVIAGQELPTADIALFTRCVNLAFSQTSYTQEEKEMAAKMVEMRDTGELSSITAYLSTFRQVVVDNFQNAYAEAFSELKKMGKNFDTSSRMIENNAVLFTIFEILKTHLKFPFDQGEIFKVLSDNMIRQSAQISNENEVSVFWDILEYLATSGLIQQGVDYKMDTKNTVNNRIFDKPKSLLYLSINRPHALYLEHHKKMHGKPGLSKISMLHYLKTHNSYIDIVANTRFNKDRSTSAYVFDYGILAEMGIALKNEPHKEEENIGYARVR